MALTRWQSELLLDIIDARRSGDEERIKTAVEQAQLRDVPQDQIENVLKSVVDA